MRRRKLITASVALAAGAALTLAATPATAGPWQAPSPSPATLAASSADSLVAQPGRAGLLDRSDGDALKRTGVVQGTRGLQYVTYARTFKGLAVVGGDVVVTTDAAGTVKDTAVAQTATIAVGTAATVTPAQAAATAKAQLARVDSAGTPELKVFAWGTPKLAYEVVVEGRTAQNKPSNLHIFVDAATGVILDQVDYVREGTGNGFYYGNVTINTSGSGSSFSLTDTTRSGLKCGGQNGSAYTGTDDAWGTGAGTNLETACVDALWGAQREVDMLSSWFNRNGILGTGSNPPIRVGLADVNAYWNGSYVNFGHNQANTRQATPIDVVGHELGHAVFQNTPGGAGSGNENGGINESTGDIFGALTEAYANNPLDPPDYQVGEEVDLVGQGPIRFMYNPSLAGDPNCYSSAIPSTEVHSAAGPLNHWFYLAAEGSSPTNGQPVSPTCNGSAAPGVGVRKAGEIYYNAMQAKTSTWKYANIRTATLASAKNLYAPSCAEFDAVKAAWAAISVPAQTGEATCSTGTPANDFSVSAAPASGSVVAGSSATTTIATATTSGTAQTVALTASGLPTGATATFVPASVTSGASSTLTITTTAATPSGTYPVTVTGTGSATHTATYTLTVTGGAGGSCTGTNGTDLPIPDAGTAVTSTITISGCARAASSASTVAVNIVHPYRGDLVIDLIAPDGTAYRLKNSSSDSADNVVATYPVNLASEAANGAWKLQVRDAYSADTGYLNTWTLTV